MEQGPNNQRQEFGPIVGTIIIVGLLVAGGVYFFFKQEPRELPPLFQAGTANSADF